MKQQNWIKEFDKEFDPEYHWQGDDWVTIKVKQFITSLLKDNTKQIIEEQKKERIPKEKKESQEVKVYHGENGSIMSNQDPYKTGWNDCIKEFNKLNK